ncbi:glucose-6-phosphate dehydrogenase [Microbacterium sp. P02]|uniref:glucose-6-phosphate dehydrogenase n=1 Tax=unclassified Microbacterium TaxID=2609290 RepID=UPI00366C7FD6
MATDTTLIILGASGDLTSRLLLPALGQLLTRERERRIRLIGAGIDDWDDERWRKTVATSFAKVNAAGAGVNRLLKETDYRQVDITSAEDMAGLLAGIDGKVALYFAVPPAVAAASCEALARIDVPAGLMLALEKPFGTDQASAHVLNEQLAKIVPENQVYRIDHFLGRSTVLNVLGARFSNRIFEPVWSSAHIDSVVIRFDEALGLEGRAGYYDKAGALIDMIQSHLLQILAVVAMDPPATLDAVDLRDAKGAVLRATSVWQDDPIDNSHRARYTAGKVGRRSLPAYADEPGVDPNRETETLAEMTVGIANSRWEGVPFTLRSGKALGGLRREIVITFKPVTHLPTGFTGSTAPSVLRLSLDPAVMSLEINFNGPGDAFALDRAALDTDLAQGGMLAYAEVLSGILDQDPTLAVRGDTAEECWRIVQPVLDAWRDGAVPLDEYAAGTTGPASWPAL